MRKMKRIAICRWVIFLILVGILSEVSAKADDWRLKKITITGNKTFKTSELKTLMGLKKEVSEIAPIFFIKVAFRCLIAYSFLQISGIFLRLIFIAA